MYIIAGLGNPERKYDGTRHNIGFSAITVLADKYDISLDIKKHKAICGKGYIEGQKVILAMPQTYMNLSGESIRELVEYYKIDPEKELIIIYDDINLAVLNAVTILRDLEYNDMTIESIASNKSQKFNDETYNIFNPKGNDNNYLDIIQNEDDTNAEENEEIDTDLVK